MDFLCSNLICFLSLISYYFTYKRLIQHISLKSTYQHKEVNQDLLFVEQISLCSFSQLDLSRIEKMLQVSWVGQLYGLIVGT